MLFNRFLSITKLKFFKKEDLYPITKKVVKNNLIPSYTPPIIPEDVVSDIEFTINGLTLEQRRFKVENAPNPKDDKILSHLDICPDWNLIIEKGLIVIFLLILLIYFIK